MIYSKVAYCSVKHTQNTGGISKYFIENSNHFYLYIYPSSYKNEPSFFAYYLNGILIDSKNKFFYRGKSKMLINLFYLINFFYFILIFKINNTDIIVNYPFLLFFSGFQSFFTKNRIIFWIWDYFPSKSGTMKFYHLLVNWYKRRVNRVVFLSSDLKKIYCPETSEDDVITFGVLNKKVKRMPQKNLIGFLGSMKPGSGIESVIDAMVINKNIKLEIIGEGSSRQDVEKYVRKMRVNNRVFFYGFLRDNQLEKIISRWAIGMAIYDVSKESITHFTDPSKVKFYIENEIPIVMSKISYFQKVLPRAGAGIVIKPTAESIISAIKAINKDYEKYAKGVVLLKKELDYSKKYENNFEFLCHS